MLVARAAHELWRERILREGWRAGRGFDTSDHTHEALVPFDELTVEVQRDVEFEVVASGVIEQLAALDLHPRGDDAVLVASSVRSGQRVRFAGTPASEGTVIGCTFDPLYGWPELVHVRWDDGAETSHPLAAGDLLRVEPGKD